MRIAAGACLLLALSATTAFAQRGRDPSAVAGSKHDLSVSSGGPVSSAETDACIFCHASHLPVQAGQTSEPSPGPLWNRELPVNVYEVYQSPTLDAAAADLGAGNSKLCLSCHDGTVAPGRTLSRGQIRTSGRMRPRGRPGTDLSGDHPVGLRPVDDGQLTLGLTASPARTDDPDVKLYGGRIECLTCHDPHVPGLDPVVRKFLARSNSGGELCLACHDPDRAEPNSLHGWQLSAHATSGHAVSAGSDEAGTPGYGTVAADACGSCHRTHDAGSAPLLRAREEETCAACHGGAGLSPAIPNVMREFAKTYSHPALDLSGEHSPGEDAFPLRGNRHAECADCHQPHRVRVTSGAPAPPAIQPAMAGASGFDGVAALLPASNEYEVCFKCHADSPNKQSAGFGARYGYSPLRQTDERLGDPGNLREKFSSSIARHNVTQPRRLSDAELPSIRPFIRYPDGTQGRPLAMGTYLYCSDCHSSDTPARAGGADGPHGSIFPHILAARYEYEFAAGAAAGFGSQGVAYLPGAGGTYALCNLCHDLEGSILRNESFAGHYQHVVEQQASCATCHAPHGIHDSTGDSAANSRLVSFDRNLVRPASNGLLGMEGAAGGCYLGCHGKDHSPGRY